MINSENWLGVLFVILSSAWSSMQVNGFRCWQCDTLADEGCGIFGLVRETDLIHYTTECSPYGKLRRGCYRVELNDPEAGHITYLFCAPDLNTTLICDATSDLHIMEGRGRRVVFCDGCRSELCNASTALHFNVLVIFCIIIKQIQSDSPRL